MSSLLTRQEFRQLLSNRTALEKELIDSFYNEPFSRNISRNDYKIPSRGRFKLEITIIPHNETDEFLYFTCRISGPDEYEIWKWDKSIYNKNLLIGKTSIHSEFRMSIIGEKMFKIFQGRNPLNVRGEVKWINSNGFRQQTTIKNHPNYKFFNRFQAFNFRENQ